MPTYRRHRKNKTFRYHYINKFRIHLILSHIFCNNRIPSIDSSAAIRSFHCTMSHIQSSLQNPGLITIHNVERNSQSRLFIQSLTIGEKHLNSPAKWKRTLVSSAKTAEAISIAKSDAALQSFPKDSTEKKPSQNATFPNGFEALVLEVCDETQIAELKVKVGEFEMHMKRNIGVAKSPLPNIYPTTPPPVVTVVESAPATLPPSPGLPKSSSGKTNPFVNVSVEKSPKLAALEASGTSNYVLVSSTVGVFRRSRTVKGKKQPPICKEGDLIKEGQVIGYLDQFGTALPVKSGVSGEVLKLLFEDGEPVGYGNPLVAISPSFQNIK